MWNGTEAPWRQPWWSRWSWEDTSGTDWGAERKWTEYSYGWRGLQYNSPFDGDYSWYEANGNLARQYSPLSSCSGMDVVDMRLEIQLVSMLTGGKLATIKVNEHANLFAVRLAAANAMVVSPGQVSLFSKGHRLEDLKQLASKALAPDQQLQVVVGSVEQDAELGPVFCRVCQMWLNGPQQMQAHRLGQKHRAELRAHGGTEL